MKITGKFSFNNGEEYINKHFHKSKLEIEKCIKQIDKNKHKNKISQEKNTKGKKLYNPKEFNKQFRKKLSPLAWKPLRVKCDYTTKYYTKTFTFSLEAP